MTITNPITRIDVRGDGFAVGHGLGAAQAEAIRERVFITPEFAELKARWLESPLLGQLEAAARSEFPQHVREIEGMAAGAELDFDLLFLWNCRGDLRLPEAGPEAEGCTCVLLPAADDGPAIIAHNEDGAPEFLGHCAWVSVEADEGPAFESFMYPGMLPGHTFGANARGLVQTINNIRVHDLKPGVPRQVITRAVLSAENLDAALDLLRRDDRASGFHHALGETAGGRVVSVEAPASGYHVEAVEAPKAHANHLIYPTFDSLDQAVTESSRVRQETAQRMLADGETTPETVLFDEIAPVYRANDQGDDYSQTLATGIFRLQAGRLDWTVHASPQERDAVQGVFHTAER